MCIFQSSTHQLNDEEPSLCNFSLNLHKIFNNSLEQMGQACKNPQSDIVSGLPAPKTATQLCQTASIQQKSEPETPFAHLPPAVSAKIRELNYCPEQLQGISACPVIQLSNGLTYQGPFENNQMSGVCRLAMPDGSYFQGSMERNQLNGEGVLIDPRGEYYKGRFKDNRAEGKGVYVGDDFIYEGEFKKNLYFGHGKLTKTNEVFEGLFQKGKMKRGKLTKLVQESICIYQGEFQGNIENGLGKLTKTGSTYEGIFKNGYLQGEGKVKQPEGDQMVCQFQKGQIVSVTRLFATQTGQSKAQPQSLRVTA